MATIFKDTITQTFLERVRLEPDRAAFWYKPTHPNMGPVNIWKSTSFREFYHQCRFLSYGLRSHLNPKTAQPRVALCSSTRFEWPLIDLAILGAKAITVPLYANSHPSDWALILQQSGTEFLFLESGVQLEKLLTHLESHPEHTHAVKTFCVIDPGFEREAHFNQTKRKDLVVLNLRSLVEAGKNEEPKYPTLFDRTLTELTPQDLFMICYTSGTTGAPKGACLTHENLMSVLKDAAQMLFEDPAFKISPHEQRVLSFLPFSHVLGKVESMAIWCFGWEQYFCEHPDQLVSNMVECKPTILFSVPRVFEKAHEKIRTALKSVSLVKRFSIEAAIRTAQMLQAKLWEGEALTVFEKLQFTSSQVLLKKVFLTRFGGALKTVISGGAALAPEIQKFFWAIGIRILEGYGLTETCAPVSLNTPSHCRPGTVGIPLPEVAIKISSEGEVLIKSKKVFKGYWENPAETKLALQDGWLHTGDLGHIDSQGFLHITDRKKDLIITSSGKNVAPQKIENLARLSPFFGEFFVYGDRKNFLSALITLRREEVIGLASKELILFSEYEELLKHPKIIERVQKELDHLNHSLSPFEQIRKFALLSEDFTIDSGELTPSLKVRRSRVVNKYRETLDRLYETRVSATH